MQTDRTIRCNWPAALAALLVLSAAWLPAQPPAQPPAASDLYMPRDIRRAYDNGTRKWDGSVADKYWQNAAAYTIRATVMPQTRQIRGEETVVYTNNSPDTLRQVVIRLYPDLFKEGAQRDRPVDPSDVTKGVEITKLRVAGKDVAQQAPVVRRIGTNLVVRLAEPLLPKQSLQLELGWNFTHPGKTTIRVGTYADSSLFVGYWYPQVAVYDDINGWDLLTYSGTVEFYNDFSSFDVSLTVPQGYLVWATGRFVNPEAVLSDRILGRYRQATTADQVVKIVTPKDLELGGLTRGTGPLTYRFEIDKSTDFAFALSNRYLWDASSVVVDSASGRRVTVGAAYNPTSSDFYHVAQYSRETVAYLSHQLPGVPYPFPSVTVFNGSGGMEFPGMVNNGSFPTAELAAEVAAHEIAHTYFPFYMGINERYYSWMDEGWAQFLPNDLSFTHPETGAKFTVQRNNALAYGRVSGTFAELPMIIPSYALGSNYLSFAVAAYYRSSVSYHILQDMLGKDKFRRVLQEYMRRWNGKHPIPYDYFFSFNDAAGENLNWFWRSWYLEAGYPDLALGNVSTSGKNLTVQVLREGRLPVPVHLTVTYADGSTETVHETARVWADGATTYTVKHRAVKPVHSITLGDYWIPDSNPADNLYQAN